MSGPCVSRAHSLVLPAQPEPDVGLVERPALAARTTLEGGVSPAAFAAAVESLSNFTATVTVTEIRQEFVVDVQLPIPPLSFSVPMQAQLVNGLCSAAGVGLPATWGALTHSRLRSALARVGLPTSGLKAELMATLAQHYATNCASIELMAASGAAGQSDRRLQRWRRRLQEMTVRLLMVVATDVSPALLGTSLRRCGGTPSLGHACPHYGGPRVVLLAMRAVPLQRAISRLPCKTTRCLLATAHA